jgi:1-acyl-sn-glycerol-3-phosphate acyltransferase
MDWLLNRAGDAARWIARKLVGLYYHKLFITNREHVPRSGPALFVANHANSLLDAVIVGKTAGRPVHFLAKAPLFSIPVFGPALQALGMVPAYRASDDPSQTGRNVDSINKSADCLVKDEAVGIFPEGKSHDLPRIEQVRSGAARIAIQALNQGVKDLRVVPLGINYDRKERFRSAVWVNVGEPIAIESWRTAVQEDERKAVRNLTNEIGERLKQLVTHLVEPESEPLLQDLECLHPPADKRDPLARLQQRKRIADAINYFFGTDREKADKTAWLLRHHHEALAAVGLNVSSDFLRYRGGVLVTRLLLKGLWVVIGFALALPGTVHHLIPFIITRVLARQVQAPGRSTVALSRLMVGIPIYAMWYFAAWSQVAVNFSWLVAWLWTLAMPFAGIFALIYWRQMRRFAPVLGREMAMLVRPEQIAKLRGNQEKLRVQIAALAEEYRAKEPA